MYAQTETIFTIGTSSRKALDNVLDNVSVMLHQDRPDEFVIDLLDANDQPHNSIETIFEWLGISDRTDLLEEAESARFLRLFHY